MKKRIEVAIEQVRRSFPFSGYLDEDFGEDVSNIVNEVLRMAPPPARLLDIGSGPMNITAIFARLGYRSSAVDDLGDPWHQLGDNVQRIEAFARAEGIRFHQNKPPDYKIPFTTESFDIILVNSVIEHLHKSPRELLNTAFKYARVGGVVIVTMPNSVNLRKRLSVLRGHTNYPSVQQFFDSDGEWRGHVREYTLSEAQYIVERVGGEIVVAGTYNSLLSSRLPNRIVRSIYVAFTNAFPNLRPSLLVVARKPEEWQPAAFDEEAYWSAIGSSIPQGLIPGSNHST